jgi:hypothetical protein
MAFNNVKYTDALKSILLIYEYRAATSTLFPCGG